jgi:hypothetical protein
MKQLEAIVTLDPLLQPMYSLASVSHLLVYFSKGKKICSPPDSVDSRCKLDEHARGVCRKRLFEFCLLS